MSKLPPRMAPDGFTCGKAQNYSVHFEGFMPSKVPVSASVHWSLVQMRLATSLAGTTDVASSAGSSA